MKQKDNNDRIIRSFRKKVKGLIILILLLFFDGTFAQKIIEKSIISQTSKIVVNFNIIDQIELITSDQNDKIVVIAESEDNNVPDLILKEKNGTVFIETIENPYKQDVLEIDKLCSIQPNYTSYKIKIPKNKKIDIAIIQGNFYSRDFFGELNLTVEEGIIKMNHFNGLVNVKINVGKVFFTNLKNTKLRAETNLGKINSNLLLKDKKQSNNFIEGILGENLNELNVRAILANIQFISIKN